MTSSREEMAKRKVGGYLVSKLTSTLAVLVLDSPMELAFDQSSIAHLFT